MMIRIYILAMTSVLICVFSSVSICVSSWAALDIFDGPKDITIRKKIEKRQEEVNFLDYPNECLLRGEYKEAMEASEKLLREPAAAKLKGDIAYLAGLSLLKLDRFFEARRYFNDALLAESVSGDLKRSALLGIADSYMTEERYDRAKEAYKKILSGYPDSPISCAVYFKLGEALTRLREGAEAKYYLDKVRTEFPFSFEARLAAEPKTRLMDVSTALKTEKIEESARDYYVQVGFFSEKNNAEGLCEKLVRQGFDAYISKSADGYETRYRVKVGRPRSREEAEALESKLKKAGYSTKICP